MNQLYQSKWPPILQFNTQWPQSSPHCSSLSVSHDKLLVVKHSHGCTLLVRKWHFDLAGQATKNTALHSLPRTSESLPTASRAAAGRQLTSGWLEAGLEASGIIEGGAPLHTHLRVSCHLIEPAPTNKDVYKLGSSFPKVGGIMYFLQHIWHRSGDCTFSACSISCA